MNAPLSADDRTAIEVLAASLEAAWNAGDADAFAAPFTVDTDFVNIRAEHFRGRAAVAAGHAEIFRSSMPAASIAIRSRQLAFSIPISLWCTCKPSSTCHRDHSPVAITPCSRWCSHEWRAGWQIASFHNTMQPPAPDRG